MNSNELHELFSRPERPSRSVLSVYLDVDQSRAANLNRGFETQLKDTLASIQSGIDEPAELERFTRSALRITDFVSAYRPHACVLALFLDESDGFFRHHETDAALRSEARWDRELFLQPLANMLKEFENYGIVLVDRNNVRLFTVFLDHIEERVREGFGSARVRHIKTSGTDHIGSSSQIQRKADEQVLLNLRHVAKLTDWLVRSWRPNGVVLAGKPETTAQLQEVLTKRLAVQIIGTVDIAMDAPEDDVLASARSVAAEYERGAELQKVKEIITRAAKSEKAVVGLGHTLEAMNSERVWELAYSGDFRAPGFECSKCASLFSFEKTACPYCGGALQAVGDIVERVVEHALRSGAKVDSVTGEASASLDIWGGIGALLKTRTEPVRI